MDLWFAKSVQAKQRVSFQFRQGSWMSNRSFPLNQRLWFLKAFTEFCKLHSGNLLNSSERLTLIQKRAETCEVNKQRKSPPGDIIFSGWKVEVFFQEALAWRGIMITLKMVSWSSNQWMLKCKEHRNNSSVFCLSAYDYQEENWNWFLGISITWRSYFTKPFMAAMRSI